MTVTAEAPADPTTLDVATLEAEITTLAGHLAAATARFLTLLAAFDAARGWEQIGISSCAQWLSWRCGLSATTAREHLRVAKRLTQLPVVAAEFAAGTISYSKVRAISRVATPATEDELVGVAKNATADQVHRLCRGLHRANSLEEAVKQQAGASFTHHWDDDGMLRFTGRLPADSGAILLRALEALREPVKAEPHGAAFACDANKPGQPTPDGALPGGVAGFVPAGAAGADVADDAAGADVDAGPRTTRVRRTEDRGPRADGLPDDDYRSAAELAARSDAEALVAIAAHLLECSERVGNNPIRLVIHTTEAALRDSGPVGQHRSTSHYDGDAMKPSSPPNHDEEARVEHVDDEQTGHPRPDEHSRATADDYASKRFGRVRDAEPRDDQPREDQPRDDRPGGFIENGAGLLPETVQRLACEAISEQAGDADDPEGEVSLDKHRGASRRQRRALLRRDGGCRFPGCSRARNLHAHHIKHYSHGGSTTMDNLVLLCHHHHVLLHEGRWRLEWLLQTVAAKLADGPHHPEKASARMEVGPSTPGVRLVAVGPNGERVTAAPAISGAARELPRRHGKPITPDTIIPGWAGDPLRLAYAVSVFASASADMPRQNASAEASAGHRGP